MNFKKGDYVTRKSYNNDTIFKILNIKDGICYLKGENVRLYADSPIEDLVLYTENRKDNFEYKVTNNDNLDRNEYFYMPAKILHCDGDEEYLNRCLNYYKQNNLKAFGKVVALQAADTFRTDYRLGCNLNLACRNKHLKPSLSELFGMNKCVCHIGHIPIGKKFYHLFGGCSRVNKDKIAIIHQRSGVLCDCGLFFSE